MKTLLLLVALLPAFFPVNAQSYLKSLHEHGKETYSTSIEKDFPRQMQTPGSKLRDIAYMPLNETDSTYDAYNQVWNYTHDAVHQYYLSNCKDSVITYFVDGLQFSRDIIKWDSTSVYRIYTLNQMWIGGSWINNTEEESPVQFGCYIDFILNKMWNGSSWDTTSGTQEILSFDTYGRISQRHYSHYVNSQWVTYRQVYPHYSGLSDTITGIDNYNYSTVTGQLTSAYRDTNYVWLSFSSFCNSTYSEYLHQTYDIPSATWNNAYKYLYPGNQTVGTDTFHYFLTLAWNGVSYDSLFRSYIKYDYMGNWVEEFDETYDLPSQTWINTYTNQYNYTYGPSNEILRIEYVAFECAPYYDLLTPCYVHLYSDFIPCGVPTDVDEVNHAEHGILIFPSPASSQLTISSTIPLTDATITIYDMQGKRMNVPITIQNNTAQLRTQDLPDGFYMLQIINIKTDEIEAGKFVKGK